MARTVAFIIAALFAFLTGCAHPNYTFSSIETFAALPRGIGLADFEHRLKSQGDTIFCIKHAGHEYRCLEFCYYHDSKERIDLARYWCIFRDGWLDRIPAIVTNNEQPSPSTSQPSEHIENWLRDLHIEEVINGKDQTSREIIAAVRSAKPTEGCGNWAILGFIGWPILLADDLDEQARLDRYNPRKVRLGMTSTQVAHTIDRPWRAYSLYNGAEVCIYGSGLDERADNGWDDATWLAVLFEKDRAIGVFCQSYVYPLLPSGHPMRNYQESSTSP